MHGWSHNAGGHVNTGAKAVEGHRSPGRFASQNAAPLRDSVLDCASPLALSNGVAKVRCIKETRSYSLKMVRNLYYVS
jgi:hypothetical protein